MFLGSILLVLGFLEGFEVAGTLIWGFFWDSVLWVCFVVFENLTLALLFCVFQSVWQTQSMNFNSNQL